MTISHLPELKGVSAKLSQDGSVDLAGNRLWMVPAEETDRPYIISTWVSSYKQIAKKLTYNHNSGATKHVGADLIQEAYPRLVERIWKDSYVLRDESGTACHGYICGKNLPVHILHYMYLPPELRNIGLSKVMRTYLFGEFGYPVQVTSFLPWKHWPKDWKFNPYAMVL